MALPDCDGSHVPIIDASGARSRDGARRSGPCTLCCESGEPRPASVISASTDTAGCAAIVLHSRSLCQGIPNSSQCSSHSFRRTDASARRSSRVSHLGSVDPCRRSLLAVPLRARAAVVHWRSSETNCRVRRLLLVATHRCARPMSLRGLGYAGPLVAALCALRLSLRLCTVLGVGPGPRCAGGAVALGQSEAKRDQDTRIAKTRMIITRMQPPLYHIKVQGVRPDHQRH